MKPQDWKLSQIRRQIERSQIHSAHQVSKLCNLQLQRPSRRGWIPMSMSDYQHTIKEKHSVSNTLILWVHQGKTGDGRACLPSQVIITIINDEERDGARSVQHRVSSVNGTMTGSLDVGAGTMPWASWCPINRAPAEGGVLRLCPP